MPKPKTQLTKRQIEALSLDDLLGDLDPQKLAKAAAQPGTAPRRAQLLNREAEREQAIAEAARRHRQAQAQLSPWLPEATILCLEQVTCSHCGSQTTVPAAETLLVRFRHRRDGSTWEVANHPCQLNPSLPREQKFLHRSVHACQQCFQSPEALEHYRAQAQGGPAQ